MMARVIKLRKAFKNYPKLDDFELIQEDLRPLQDKEFLAQCFYLSIDPLIRVHTTQKDVSKPVMGLQLAKIIQSKTDEYPVGGYVVGEFGWKSHTIASESSKGPLFDIAPSLLKDLGSVPKSLALGVLGLPGNAAYLGLLNILKPEKGQTVVISAAASAVGSHVGQIAKIKGCHVVGITGSDAKGQYLVNELNFDSFLNYKNDDFNKKLEEFTPNRVDCYFDNVGGEISSAVLNRMKKFGKVAICGAISLYNKPIEECKASEVQTPVKIYHVRMEGFHTNRWIDQWDEAVTQNLKWIEEGKLKYKETVIEGFENAPDTFIRSLQGQLPYGKVLIKV